MAALQCQNPVGAAGKIQIVGDVDGGEAAGSMQILKQVHDHFPGPEIQAAGGLVGQQHSRVAHQRARQNHALLLSAR